MIRRLHDRNLTSKFAIFTSSAAHRQGHLKGEKYLHGYWLRMETKKLGVKENGFKHTLENRVFLRCHLHDAITNRTVMARASQIIQVRIKLQQLLLA